MIYFVKYLFKNKGHISKFFYWIIINKNEYVFNRYLLNANKYLQFAYFGHLVNRINELYQCYMNYVLQNENSFNIKMSDLFQESS